MASRRSDLVDKLELAERQLIEDADRVVAEEEATGAAMVAWLAGAGDLPVRLDVPPDRTRVAAVAAAAGLAPVGRITRLERGEVPMGRRERMHALAAPWAG